DAFGSAVLTPGGELDRQRMRERVFADADERKRLETIIHPRVRAALLTAAQGCTAPYCLLVIPLLAEVRADYAFVDRALVVDVSPSVQLRRLMQRDATTVAEAERMIAAQAPREERLAMADDVIDNDGTTSALEVVIARLHVRYLELAARAGTSS